MSPVRRFRQSLVFRIGSIFLAVLLVTSVAAVVSIRQFIRKDLQDGTRREMVSAMKRMEGDLLRLRNEALLFAQFAARTAQAKDRAKDRTAATLQISVIEESRAQGIEIGEFAAEKARRPEWNVLHRGFAGIRTVDYIVRGTGAGRLHILAVAPAGFQDSDRRVITAAMPLSREFLRRESANLGGDVTLLAKGDLIASSSSCVECIRCLDRVLADGKQWTLLDAGKPIYFTFDCRPDSQAVVVLPVRTFDGRTVAMALSRSRKAETLALYHATLGLLGGTLALGAAMTAAFLLLTSRTVRPLRELTRLSMRISEGQYGETAPVAGAGEVAELAQAFNRMSVSLRDASREISQWNALLESRVEEKTRELEKVHLQMAEVEKLAAVGQLAAGVAHELNNPLSGIMGYADVAIERYRDKPPEIMTPEDAARMAGYFNHIQSLTQRCRAIILDMLTFARHHTEEVAQLDLNDVIRQTLAFLEKEFDRSHVTLSVDLAEGLPPVSGSATQLQQVFTNLTINAIHAMPGGGALTVRSRISGTALEVAFQDVGVGIDPALQRRIFEPFFTTKPVGKGTGLGLSVSYGIVKRHGGEIRVASEPGRGSEFTVVLPVCATVG